MTELNSYIGGNFSSQDDVSFLKESTSHNDIFFPELCNTKTRILFETGIDALAAICGSIWHGQKEMRMWVPANFCRESLSRLQIKLSFKLTILFFDHANEIFDRYHDDDLVLILHFNCYKPSFTKELLDIRFARKLPLILIEDFVHCPLEIRSFGGDYAFNSLRKFSNLDVAVCYLEKFSPQRGIAAVSEYHRIKQEAAEIKSMFQKTGNPDLEPLYLQKFAHAEKVLQNSSIYSAATSDVARFRRLDLQRMKEVRQQNFAFLKAEIASLSEVEVLDGEYSYFMIKTTRRDELRRRCFSSGIFPAIHWADSGHAGDLLSFHIDHRYSPSDLNRLITLLRDFYGR